MSHPEHAVYGAKRHHRQSTAAGLQAPAMALLELKQKNLQDLPSRNEPRHQNYYPHTDLYYQPASIVGPSRQPADDIFKKFGVAIPEEVVAHNEIARKFGSELADELHRKNLESYAPEFCEDEILSDPYTYYTIDGECYIEPYKDDLLKVKNGINPAERDGLTYEAFCSFESLVARPDKEVVTWYSPEGDSNLGTDFDSGRLYICVKGNNKESTHLNFKVRPEFPVITLLNSLYKEAGQHVPIFRSKEDAKMFYLSTPISTGLSTEEFFFYLEHLGQSNIIKPKELVYVSRRLEEQKRKEHTYEGIIRDIKKALTLYQLHPKDSPVIKQSLDSQTYRPVTSEQLLNRYLQVISPYVHGSFHLYGCSTTSVVTSSDLMNAFGSGEPGFSMYGSGYRQFTDYLHNLIASESFLGMNTQRCTTCGGREDGHYHCEGKFETTRRRCNKKFEDETYKPQSKWTKICPDCSFEFACAKLH